MTRRRSIMALLAFVLGRVSSGCSAPEGDRLASSASAKPGQAPVPERLLGTLIVSRPLRSYEILRDRYDLGLVGRSWSTNAALAVGLPVTAGEAFDEAMAVRAAILRAADGSLELAFGLPLRAPDRLIGVATLGADAPFRAEPDSALNGERLTPTRDPGKLLLAVIRNCLVVGSSAAVVAAAGPFLADPEQPAFAVSGDDDVSGRIQSPALARMLAAVVAELAERAGAGVLGAQLSSFAKIEAALGEAGEVTASLRVEETGVRLSLTAPLRGLLAETMAKLDRGTLPALLACDRDASFALALHEQEAERVASAEKVAAELARFGTDGREPDGARAALTGLARARGPGFRFAIERGPIGALAYGVCDLANEDGARSELRSFVKAMAGARDADGLRLSVAETVMTRIGEVTVVTLERRDPKSDAAREAEGKRLASLVARIDGNRLYLATGSDALAALRKALGQRADDGPASLGELASVRAVQALLAPTPAAAFMYLDAQRLFATKPAPGDPTRDRSALLASLSVLDERVTLVVAADPPTLKVLATPADR